MVRPGIHDLRHLSIAGKSIKGQTGSGMSFKTSVVLLKSFLPVMESVYNSTFVTARQTRIATIPVGYGDGYAFILSQSGRGFNTGERAPIVGRGFDGSVRY